MVPWLFYLGCVPFRFLLVLLLLSGRVPQQRPVALAFAAIAVSFLVVFALNLRPRGRETGYQPIW